MICPNKKCKKEIQIDSKLCPYCGYNISIFLKNSNELFLYAKNMIENREYVSAKLALREASRLGNSYAMVLFGSMYEKGLGVSYNDNHICYCYENAAKLKNQDAIYFLAKAFMNGTYGKEKDYFKAFSYYQELDLGRRTSEFELLENWAEEKNVEKSISISFDCENIIFVASISYSVDGNIIKQEQIESNPYYSEEKNDYFIYVDGEELSLSETIEDSNFDMCIALVDDAAYLTAIAVVAVVIVAMPVIEKVISEFVAVVTEWFTSFWNWLRGKITRKVTYQPVYKEEIKYEVRYNNYTYTLVETDVRVKTINEKKYYLCVISTDEHKLYMSPIPLPDKFVAPILASSKYVTSFSKTGNSYCLSTYTKENKDAYNAALAASRLMGLNYATFHSKYASNGSIKSGLQFDHYHPGYETGRCSHAHSLFGIPTLKV